MVVFDGLPPCENSPIESRADITYQLLISTVETMAGLALGKYEPDEAVRVNTKKGVFNKARAYGLSE